MQRTKQELDAIKRSEGTDLTTEHAANVRAFLVERYGADVVTDEIVASVIAAQRDGAE